MDNDVLQIKRKDYDHVLSLLDKMGEKNIELKKQLGNSITHEILKIDVKSGDLLMIRVSKCTNAEAQRLHEEFAELLPDGVNFEIVNADLIDFAVIRKDSTT